MSNVGLGSKWFAGQVNYYFFEPFTSLQNPQAFSSHNCNIAVLSVPSSRGAEQGDLGISCGPGQAARLGGAEDQPLGGAGEGL